MSKSSLHLALQFSIRFIKGSKPFRNGLISVNLHMRPLHFAPGKLTVRLNMSERGNGQSALAKRTVRNRISSDIWEQIKTGYAAGINLREIARKMDIPEGTVLAHAKRHGSPRGGAEVCLEELISD
jgi:hypothetical protein